MSKVDYRNKVEPKKKKKCTVYFNNIVESFLLHVCILQEIFCILRYYIAYSKTEFMVLAL